MRCDICQFFLRPEYLREHKQRKHQEFLDVSIPNVYPRSTHSDLLMYDGSCYLGCGFKTKSNDIARDHLILYHSDNQLKKWGFSREFLKYEAGYILLEEFKY